jgi:hypothetical protein
MTKTTLRTLLTDEERTQISVALGYQEKQYARWALTSADAPDRLYWQEQLTQTRSAIKKLESC